MWTETFWRKIPEGLETKRFLFWIILNYQINIQYRRRQSQCIYSMIIGQRDSKITLCGLMNTEVQWNLSVTTTSKIKYGTFDLFSNVF